MARARVQEPAVQRGTEFVHVDHPQANRLAAALAGEDLARMLAVGGDEAEHAAVGRLQSERIGKRHDAAPAVAAHHPAGTVGIVVLHPEIVVRVPGQDHQSVGADASVRRGETRPAVAQRGNAPGRPELGDILLPAVQHDEVVACTRVFMELYHF